MQGTAAPTKLNHDGYEPAVLDCGETTTHLKAHPNTNCISVLALTTHAMACESDCALAARCEDNDAKPVIFRRLFGRMDYPSSRALM